MTYGALLDEMTRCQTRDEAAALIKREVAEVLKHRSELLDEEARSIVIRVGLRQARSQWPKQK